MNAIAALFRREFFAYFATPLAYIFLVIFLVLTGVFTFYLGSFYERSQADLESFFTFHPWLYLFLVPAIAMRLWAEERKSGTVELLLTLPISMWQAVMAKICNYNQHYSTILLQNPALKHRMSLYTSIYLHIYTKVNN